MQSTLTPEETDPHDIFVIEPDVVLAARADKPAAEPGAPVQPSSDQTPPPAKPAAKAPAIVAEDIMGDILSRPSTPKLRVVPDMAVAAPMPPSKPVPPVDTRFRATAATADTIAKGINPPGDIKIPDDILLNGARPSRGAWARRATFGFLFALASVAAAEGWERYGDTATQMMAGWTAPLFALNSSQPASATAPPASTAAAVAQPAQPAVQAAVTDQTASPPAPAAVQPAQDTAAATPAATSAAPSAQALQSMTQDLAAMGQQIDELKATIAQLKAGQEQMAQQISRDIVKNAVARTSEGRPPEARTPERGHSSALVPARKPPHAAYSAAPTATAYVRPPPGPPYPPQPTAAPAPMQVPPVTTDPDGDLVVRPPMPLR